MTFNAGELVATIRLDGIDRYETDVGRAGSSLTKAGATADKMGEKASAAVKGAAVATVALVTSGAALTASLFNQGIAYNTLQQTSRAALKTLTGGAEQANEQMDKLDAFAKNSPFSKSIFISAQQQLLGFGMEAKKVIPTLDAVQQAVAATGGSSQQLSEITFVLAQIQAAGKITGQDLMQLGQRGINAAELIGSTMGKTGQQIKEEITAGTLGADVALDALTKGMATKFAGASAGVKGTITGTVDRIKAASREIGATLAEPFVSQKGGGLYVTWGNQVADIMRGILSHTGPVVSMLTQRALPTFAAITTTLDRANVTVRSFNVQRINDGLETLSQYKAPIAALGGAITLMAAGSLPVVGRLVAGVNPLAGALLAVVATSPELRAAGGEILNALSPLMPVVGELVKIFAGGLNAALPVTAGLVRTVADVLLPLVGIIADIPTPVLAAVGGLFALNKGMDMLKPSVTSVVEGLQRLAQQAAVQTALAGMEGNTSKLAGAFGVAGTAATGMGNKMKAAFMTNPVGLALLVIAGAVAGLTAVFAYNAAKAQAMDEQISTLKDTLTDAASATEATATAIRSSLTDAMSDTAVGDTTADLLEMGFAADQMAAAVVAGGPALDALKDRLNAAASETEAITDSAGNYSIVATSSALAAGLLADELAVQEKAIAEARKQQKLLEEATREAAAAMTDAERSNGRLNDALKIARDTSQDATTRISALRQAIDELKGGSLSAAEAENKLAKTSLDLADALTETNDQGEKIAGTFISATGAIDQQTRAGADLATQMIDAGNGMSDAAIAAYDLAVANGDVAGATEAARAAGQGYINKLRETMLAAGLTKEQVDGLIATYFATPETVATLITDNGTIDATQQQLMTLSERIMATPDKTITVKEPMSPAIIAQLQSLGIKVTSLPDGTVQVNANGIEGVELALATLTRKRYVTVQVNQAIQKGVDPGQAKAAYANGGMRVNGVDAYANGGMRSYANGGVESGIFNGRAGGIIKFAEQETGWEAFISGKVGQEARNRRVLGDAAQRLGMAVVPLGEQRNSYIGARSSTSASAGVASVSTADKQVTIIVNPAPGMNEDDLAEKVAAKLRKG